MSEKPVLSARLTERKMDAFVLAAAAFARTAAFALADGGVVFFDEGGQTRRVEAHPGANVLVASVASGLLATGGDDGRVVVTDRDGECRTLADEGGKWIDALALRDDGAAAWSVGKTVRARDARGDIKTLVAPSTIRGLCFLPKGYRLALACYNGVQLWFPNTAAEPEHLEWRGSHLDVVASPDNRFVVSSMQENALHGWRLVDRKNMRMTGYPTKTRSFSWSSDGQWLATSGAEACIVWPFSGKDGPMGKGPLECGVRSARVTQVAFHPKALEIAIGFDDGWILLCRMGTLEEAAVRVVEEGAQADPISALCWSKTGDRLYYGTQGGAIGSAEL